MEILLAAKEKKSVLEKNYVGIFFPMYLKPLVIWKCKCFIFNKKQLRGIGIEGDSNWKGQILLMFVVILLGQL